MLKGPSNQPGPHAAIDTGKANEDQSVRKHDVIRGILGFSKSKTEKADAITTNQAVHAQNTPQVVGSPTASLASDIHSAVDQPATSSSHIDKPLPAPAVIKKTPNIFLENLPAPVKTELPAVQDRIEVTQQLAYCTALLLRGTSPPLATAAQFDKQACDPIIALQKIPNLDNKELDWLAEMDKNPPAKERIHWLGTRMVDEFAKDVLKDSTEIAEIVLLGPVLDNETYRSLLSCTIAAFEQSVLLNVDLLQGLVQLVQVAPPEALVSDDLVKILRVLRICLQDTHQQSSVHPFHLTLALSRLLDVMTEHKVKDLNRVEDHEPLSGILSALKDSSDPYLMYQACYAFQALQYVPDDESVLQSILRHGAGVVNGLIQVSSVFKLDLGAVLEGLDKLQEALGGIIEVASDVYKGVSSVVESGRGVLDSLKEGFSEGKKRPWYATIRVAQALVQAGQLKDLNQLIYEAPCRSDPLFQWGICQLLGEIASDVLWDTNVRQQAVDVLGELYKDDSQWGKDESVKTWMINIIGQLSTDSDQAINTMAIALLKEVHQDQGTTTRLPYPLRSRFPLLPTSPLLARVLAIPDVEYHLHNLRLQRLEEHRKDVYIPPQAKPSLQSADDTLFSLMEKMLEFLAGPRQVFLVLGDSGAGKSTFNLELEHTLWKDYKKYGPIPLYINLPTIDDPAHDLIEKQLKYYNFSEDQIQEMKLHRQFILICDGYDESQLKVNIHTTNQFNQSGQWNVKVVISCRSQYLGQDYRSRFQPQPVDRYQRVATDLFQEAVVAAFTRVQIQQYVDEYVKVPAIDPIQNKPTWTVEEYMDKLVNIPNLMDLVSNPFLLTLALDALPSVVASKEDLSAIRITRVQLYDSFVKRWLEVNRMRLERSPLSSKERLELHMLAEDGFLYHGIHYQKDLATAIFIDHAGNPVVKYTHLRDKDTWKAVFFNPSGQAKLLRESSTVKRYGAFFRFLHRSLLEYFYSRTIYDPLDYDEELDDGLDDREPGPDIMACLSRMNIVTEPSIVQFLAERVPQDPSFRQQLLDVVEVSKADTATETIKVAATNAITILVKAGVTFHGADLRGVKIPGADLSGGQFDHAQFQGADLTKVNLSRSWLRKADMSGAQMDGVQFGELPYLELDDHVDACAYSPDGRTLVVGITGRGITVSIYDTSSWTKTYSFTAPSSVLVQTMAFSPDRTRVVFGGNDGLVRLWDCASGQEIFIMEGHSLKVNYVTFSPCGKHIASSSDDETVQVWDSQTGESLFVLKGHTSEVWGVKYSPSGERLVSGDRDGTIRLWDSETGEPGVVLQSSLGGTYNLAFSPDGRWMASGHEEGELQLWHAESGEQGPVLHGHNAWVTGIAFSPDSRWIASTSRDETVRLWDASTGTPINTLSSHKAEVYDVVFSPDGLQITSGGGDSKVRLWDVDSSLASSVEQQDQLGAVWKTVYSADGQAILTASDSKTVKQWSSLTGESRPPSIELSESLSDWSVSYSLDGRPTVAGTQDGNIRLWELQDGGRETILEGSTAVQRVIMSPCCRWIVYVDEDNTVMLWDLESIQQKHVVIEKGGVDGEAICNLAFSPTGHRLAVVSYNGTIWLINSQSKRLITSKSTDWSIEAMSFSPDGHQLAVGTYCSIYLRDLQSDERVIKLRGHTELVKCIAYSPCGDWIASGSYDKTVRLWRRRRPPGDTESWSCVSKVHGFFGMIFDIAWSPTVPMEFVTGCVDESVRVWRVSNDGEDIVVKLLWGTNLTVLHADGLVLEGTTGLGSAEQKLLVQCGAFDGSLKEGDEEDDYTDSEGVESDDNTDSEGVESDEDTDSEGVESDDDTDSEGVESEDDTDSEGVELDDDMDSAGVESDDEE